MPIDFKKLKSILAGKPKPSTYHVQPDYADNYKSPYSDRGEVAPRQQKSAPSVLVSNRKKSVAKPALQSEKAEEGAPPKQPLLGRLLKGKDYHPLVLPPRPIQTKPLPTQKVVPARKAVPPRIQSKGLPRRKPSDFQRNTNSAPNPLGSATSVQERPTAPVPLPPPSAGANQDESNKKNQAQPVAGKAPASTSLQNILPKVQTPRAPGSPPPPPAGTNKDESNKKTQAHPVAGKALASTSLQSISPKVQTPAVVAGQAPTSTSPQNAPPKVQTPAPVAGQAPASTSPQNAPPKVQTPTSAAAAQPPASTRREVDPPQEQTPAAQAPESTKNQTVPPQEQTPAAQAPAFTRTRHQSVPSQEQTPAAPAPASTRRQSIPRQEKAAAVAAQPGSTRRQSSPQDQNPAIQQLRKGSSNSADLAVDIKGSVVLPPKPAEISGFFNSDPEPREKKFSPSPVLFENPSQKDDEDNKAQEEQGKDSTMKSANNPKTTTVKFSGEESDAEVNKKPVFDNLALPKHRISFKEGSVDVDISEIGELPPLPTDEELYGYDDGDTEPELYKNTFKDYLRSSFSENAVDSLTSLCKSRSRLNLEKLSEYQKHRLNFCIFFIFTLLLLIVIFFVLMFFVMYCRNGFADGKKYYSNVHMMTSIIGGHLLFSISAQIYRIFPYVSRTNMKFVHGTLNILASVITSGGLYAAHASREMSKLDHLVSLHDYIGIIVYIFTLSQIMLGLSTSLPVFTWDTRASLIPIHKQLSICVIWTDYFAILTGCLQISQDTEEFTRRLKDPESATLYTTLLNLIPILTLFSASVVLFIVTNYNFRRRPIPQGRKAADPDVEELVRVETKRKSLALQNEAFDSIKDEGDVQIGSKKSFKMSNATKTWKPPIHAALSHS